MTYSIEQIVAKLKAARKATNLSQAELGARVGLPQSHISKIESGRTDLKLSSLIELARILELELVFVPRKLLPAVRSIIRTTSARDVHTQTGTDYAPSATRSAYALDDNDG